MLYNKYCPSRFAEVIGQDFATKSLRADIVCGAYRGSAYLLTGPSGSGKTTLAHILARASNCDSPVSGEPCGQCPPCLDKKNPGLIRKDASSERGIDDIKNLRGELGTSPLWSKHKVYLLDEAHGLTGDAREALLGILEDLPPHTTIVFATTHPASEFDEPLLSRCRRRFDLARVPAQAITDLLATLAPDLDAGTFSRLARLSRGNVREALRNLDSLIAALPPDMWSADDEEAALKELERIRLPRSEPSTRAHHLSRGRPSKGEQRRKVILRVLKDGEWHYWPEVIEAARHEGIHGVEGLRATRRQMAGAEVIEVDETGGAVMLRLRKGAV